MLGAGKVIMIDRFPERLQIAQTAGSEVINYEEVDDVFEVLKEKTKGRGPDSGIDAVGMEAHGVGDLNALAYAYDKIKKPLFQERIGLRHSDR